MKPEKQLSRKAQAGKVFRVLERKFPDEVGFVTQELGLDDKVAVSIIAAAGESANKGKTSICKSDSCLSWWVYKVKRLNDP